MASPEEMPLMTTIRHQNGTVYFQDGDYKFIISNLNEFSRLLKKFQELSSHSEDQQSFMRIRCIIDMIENARHEFITHREKQCIGDL